MKKFVCRLFSLLLIINGLIYSFPGGHKVTVSKYKPSTANERLTNMLIRELEPGPVIDGSLIDSDWKNGLVLGDFVQTFPGDNTEPTYSTKVVMGYNSSRLFIGIYAKEVPSKITATLGKRDDILNDDNITIYLDTFDDQQKAYVLTFNPYGVQQDGIYTEDAGEVDYSVDVIMYSAGKITSDGYTIEVAVPFRSLRYISGGDKKWGIHIFRKIKYLNDEENSLMTLERGNVNLLSQEGKLYGLNNIDIGNNAEVIPSFILSKNGSRPMVGGNEFFKDKPFLGDAGLSLKYNASSNLTFDFTLNPDFAQVESDQVVVTANQRFPVFFEEKRPFFLEGADIFQVPLKNVHTRTIVDPDAAAKISGKYGKYSIGFLLASDNAPGSFSDEELSDSSVRSTIEPFIDKNSFVGIARLKRDIGENSYIGLLATSYNFFKNDNYTLGTDTRITFSEQTSLALQFTGTSSQMEFYNPDIDKNEYRTGNGFGYYAKFVRSGRYLNFTVIGSGRTTDYRTNVGFTTQYNINRWSLETKYNSEPQQGSFLVSWSAIYTVLADCDWHGRMKYSYNWPHVILNFPNQTHLTLSLYADYMRLFEEEFGPKRSQTQTGAFSGPWERSTVYKGFTIILESTPLKELTTSINFDISRDYFDFDFGAGPKFPRVSPAALKNADAPIDPGPGKTLDITASLIFNPVKALNFSFDYIKSKLRRNDTKRIAYDQNIYRIGSTYHFSRFIFTRIRFDYETLNSKVRTQLLFALTPNPGTALYIGMNEDYNYDGYNPYSLKYEKGFRRNSYTFFTKLSYNFNFNF